MEKLGLVLKTKREELSQTYKGYSVRAVAKKVNISASYLSRIESGEYTAPSNKILTDLMRVLKLEYVVKIRFGEYIKGHRVKLKLTQKEFVKVFNTHSFNGRTGKITLAILKQWETGGGYPNSIRIPALIKTLQLDNLRELMQVLEYEATVKFQPVQTGVV